MAVKIFILGRPGSGKSTVAQLLTAIAQKNDRDSRHIYDYKYLHDMFQQEINDNRSEEERSFHQKGPKACQGFDVREGKFEVLDTALKQMANEIRAEEHNHSDENMLLLIEFARKEYIRALDIFGYELLKDAHVLYVKLGLSDCIERVQERANIHRLRSEYDHYVSEDIMTGYYGKDDWSADQLSKYLDHLRTINVTQEELDNSGNVQELETKVVNIFNRLVSPYLVTVP